MLAIALPAFAFDFESKRPEGYSLFFNIYESDDENAVELTYPQANGINYWYGYRQPWGELEIPSTVEHNGITYTVVAVGDRAFSGCTEISAVIFPSTVTDIGSYAFYQCSGIRGKLTLGENIITVGKSAFYGCSNISSLQFNAVKCEIMGGSRSTTAFGNCRSLKTVSFGQKVTRIPDFAFCGMDLLQFEWNMPHDLEYVGESAFAYCYSIYGTLTLPDGIKKVASNAFAQCHSLMKVVIPGTVGTIDNNAFYRCINLRTIECNAIVPPPLGNNAFYGIHQDATINVPCISVDAYRQSEQWRYVGLFRAMEPCRLQLVARSSDPQAGTVTGTGTYTVGSQATITAVCYAGYGFAGWSDGVTDNPRTVVINDTTSYTAIMKAAEVIHEVEYVHDTTYMDGIEVIYEYYEINDVAESINKQSEVVYNRDKRRIEIPFEKKEIIDLALYNDAGQCVFTGRPRNGHINMRRYPTGSYIIRVSTIDDDKALRFFHRKNK